MQDSAIISPELQLVTQSSPHCKKESTDGGSSSLLSPPLLSPGLPLSPRSPVPPLPGPASPLPSPTPPWQQQAEEPEQPGAEEAGAAWSPESDQQKGRRDVPGNLTALKRLMAPDVFSQIRNSEQF